MSRDSFDLTLFYPLDKVINLLQLQGARAPLHLIAGKDLNRFAADTVAVVGCLINPTRYRNVSSKHASSPRFGLPRPLFKKQNQPEEYLEEMMFQVQRSWSKIRKQLGPRYRDSLSAIHHDGVLQPF